MGSLSGKKLFLLGAIIILLIAIPLTAYFVQKQQETRSHAQKSSVLSFAPSSSQTNPTKKNVGDIFTLDIMLDPGSNEVIHTTLSITYDAGKLKPEDAIKSKDYDGSKTAKVSGSFSLPKDPNDPQGDAPLPALLDNPTAASGNATIILSTGLNKLRGITAPTKIASITFLAIAPTDSNIAPLVDFGPQTTISSTVADPETNVLSSKTPAFISISGAAVTLTPGPTGTNNPPMCTALSVDRVTSGEAPFSIAFTANGTDTDGTISKATFDFGDGPVKDVVSDGGIGTKQVSVQIAHTYQNPGTYKASVVLTDSNNTTSNPLVCSQTIVVKEAKTKDSSGSAGTSTPPAGQNQTITSTPTPLPKKIFEAISPPGPGDSVVGLGIAGAVITVAGAILLLAL